MEADERNRRRMVRLFCWLLFAAGLVVQWFGPQLKVANRKFVIPQSILERGNMIAPDKLVDRERRVHLIAALLTTSGAGGLAFCYRGLLFGRRPDKSTSGGSSRMMHPQPQEKKELI